MKRIIIYLILMLRAFTMSGLSFAEDGRQKEISADVIRSGCSVLFSTHPHPYLDDPLSSAPIDVIASWRCLDGENLPIDKYEINGVSPEIVTVFFWRDSSIVVLVRWSINSLAADYVGNYYKVFIYKYLKDNHQFVVGDEAMKGFPAGWDGRTKSGVRVRYPFKDAASIKRRFAAMGFE